MLNSLKESFKPFNPDEIPALEYPNGSVSLNGHRYAITSESLQNDAPRLAKEVKLPALIAEADVWLRAGGPIVSYITLALLYADYSILVCLIVSSLLFLFWESQKSAFYSPAWTSKLYWITTDAFWLLAGGAALSALGVKQGFTDFIFGLSVFFVMKIGLISKMLDWLYQKSKGFSLNDRLIRMVIIKQSIYRGLPHPAYASMQQNWQNRMKKLQNLGKKAPK